MAGLAHCDKVQCARYRARYLRGTVLWCRWPAATCSRRWALHSDVVVKQATLAPIALIASEPLSVVSTKFGRFMWYRAVRVEKERKIYMCVPLLHETIFFR